MHYKLDGIELFNCIKAGDESAFSSLIEEYQDLLYMEACRILSNDAEAQDAVQELFIWIWFKREKLELHTSLRNYLYISIKRYCLTISRNNDTAQKRKNRYAYFKETIVYPNELENKELGIQLKTAIEKLHPARQEAFEMCYLADINQKEIANQKGLSIQTIKNQVSSALKELRTNLSRIY
jgi:RNA polymerase sigma factor (sigma-70 family)